MAMPWHCHGNAMAIPWQCHVMAKAMPWPCHGQGISCIDCTLRLLRWRVARGTFFMCRCVWGGEGGSSNGGTMAPCLAPRRWRCSTLAASWSAPRRRETAQTPCASSRRGATPVHRSTTLFEVGICMQGGRGIHIEIGGKIWEMLC